MSAFEIGSLLFLTKRPIEKDLFVGAPTREKRDFIFGRAFCEAALA